MIKIDDKGELVNITEEGMVRVDGIGAMRRVVRGDKWYLQFYDTNRMRSQLRKTRFVEIPMDVFIQILQASLDRRESK
jgi:hypothetical protein